MNYKILEIDPKKQEWVKIEVTFDDGEKYVKRMMADCSSAETIDADVRKWLSDYLPAREEEKKQRSVKQESLKDTKKILNKSFDIDLDELLPKASPSPKEKGGMS